MFKYSILLCYKLKVNKGYFMKCDMLHRITTKRLVTRMSLAKIDSRKCFINKPTQHHDLIMD